LTLWDKILEIYKVKDELSPNAEQFIMKVVEFADPHDLDGELSERQIEWIRKLWDKHVNLDFTDYDEEVF